MLFSTLGAWRQEHPYVNIRSQKPMQRKADGGLGKCRGSPRMLPGVPGKKPTLSMPVKAFSIQRFKIGAELSQEEGFLFVAP